MNGGIQGWAARLFVKDRRALESLRLLRGVEVAEVGGELWARGPILEGATAALLARLPAVERFEWLADGVLRSPGARLPVGRLAAEAAWMSLTDWMPVELPSASAAAVVAERVVLRLGRGGAAENADALLLDLDAWVDWASAAPAVRLLPLRFAAARTAAAAASSSSAQALVLGQPLPPLPGQRLISRSGVIVPLGWRWRPAADAAAVRQLLGLRADECALWPGEDAPISIIPAEAFVPASRSAARLTRSQPEDRFTADDR